MVLKPRHTNLPTPNMEGPDSFRKSTFSRLGNGSQERYEVVILHEDDSCIVNHAL